jgi:site-specific DNA-methyltransferase (adenine-specific)
MSELAGGTTTKIKPYYESELVTLYHGDCLEIMEWLEADVLVTDPPYGMSYKSGKTNRPEIANDTTIQVRDDALKLWGEKPALVFGTWRVARPQATRNLLVWSKGDDPGMGDLTIPWGLSHEEIYVLGKGFVGKRESSVIKANKPPVATRPDHPTPKPVGLMEKLIQKTQGVIADPFAGSGATLVAARNLGRKVIGVEMEEKYCELIANRLSQEAFDFGGI